MAKINPVKVKQDADKEEKAGRSTRPSTSTSSSSTTTRATGTPSTRSATSTPSSNKNREAAASEYAKVADFYAKDGFLLKAIAIWKKINKLDPTALEPYLNLADLYAKQGLMMEAKGQYQIVVDEYIKRGKIREAGDVAQARWRTSTPPTSRSAASSPTSTRATATPAKAVEEHIAIAEELNKKGHLAEALQVLEKGLKIDPKSGKLRAELARVHLVQKNYDKAVHVPGGGDPAGARATRRSCARLGEAYLGAKQDRGGGGDLQAPARAGPADDEDARIQMGRVFLLAGTASTRPSSSSCPSSSGWWSGGRASKAAALLQQIVQRNAGAREEPGQAGRGLPACSSKDSAGRPRPTRS